MPPLKNGFKFFFEWFWWDEEYCYFCDREIKPKAKHLSIHVLQTFKCVDSNNPFNYNCVAVHEDENIYELLFKDILKVEADEIIDKASMGCFDVLRNQ